MNMKESLLPKFSVHRPVTVVMTLFAILVVGYIAYTQIETELFPKGFVPPYLGVWIPYREANPKEVEDQIARPSEEMLQTVSGVKHISSYSHSNGCWVWLEFSNDTDMDVAYMLVRERMDRLLATELPDDIEDVYIRKFRNDDDPIVWFGLTIPEEMDDPFFIVDYYVKRTLEQIDGVANVEMWGASEKIIQILVNQDKVKAHKINVYQLIQNLRRDNFSLSSGYVYDGNRKIYVRSDGKYRNIDDVRNIRIKGENLYLKDIAEIVYDEPRQRRWVQRIDGKKAISIGVFKESMANTVGLSNEILAKLDELSKHEKLKGMTFNVFFNQGGFISQSVDNLVNAGLWGGLFAFSILYFFLRRFKMAFIINLAIPLSLLMTVTVLYFMGWTMNMMTMMGLMLSVGLVVDNSIVIVENIYRLRNKGMSREESSVKGASEVSLAITMATLTTVVVFLPLILMNDDIGFAFYMLRIGLPVIVALIASLFVALVIIPLATTRLVSKKQTKRSGLIEWGTNAYDRILKWTLLHRLETTIIVLALMLSMQIPMSGVKQGDQGGGNINDVRLLLDMPEHYTMDDAKALVDTIEGYVNKMNAVYNVKTVNSRYSNNWGRVRVFLNPPKETQWWQVVWKNISNSIGLSNDSVMTRNEVLEDLKENVPKYPGVKIRTSWRDDSGGGSVSILLQGDDTQTLVELSEEVERRISRIPEIISVETDRDKGASEIQLFIKRDQAAKYGINPRVISGQISYALRGIELPEFQSTEREIDVRVQYAEEDMENFEQLKSMTFLTSSGQEIPLSSLVDFRIVKGMGEIHRRDGKTTLEINGFTTEDDIQMVHKKITKALASFEMPRGYTWSLGNRFMRMQETNSSQKFAVILAITFVFLLMGVLFESFILPLSVLISIPLSFFGAYWLLYITGTPFDLMAGIGLIILIGIVVNNAIVLIDMINRLRKDGLSRSEAIIEAGHHRFRPILMTAFTTIFGLIPMAVGNASLIGMPYAPLGRVMIGGLLSSTALTLVAVPLFYTFFDDLRNIWSKVQVLAFGRGKS
ncbi:efflux RND transporter permease subunit [Candidatus Marinimicrobia bacterium MT.SAG.3]|nr:efflux RND transporter permease subunit [Candidatus Marinimicrobia bacterium MT.SAG.3]